MSTRVFSAACAALMLASGAALAQTYPSKPVRIICAEVGGGTDFAARVLAPALSSALGQQVLVDNRACAGGLIAFETAAKSPPDGHTLLLHSNAMWTMPLLKKVSYEVQDFAPITLASVAPGILVVHPALPVKSVKELVALAKARPGELNYGSVGPGTPNQIGAELFKSLAGNLRIVEVAFKGGGPAVIALMAGEVQLMFASAASATPHVKSGRLRALGVTSTQRAASLPDIPTIAAAGVPGYEAVTIFGIFAPVKTPAAITARLNKEIVQILSTPDVKQKFQASGNEVVASTPEQLAQRVAAEMAKINKLVKQGNLRPE